MAASVGQFAEKPQLWLSIIQDVNRWPIRSTVLIDASHQCGTALRTVNGFDAEGDLVTHEQCLRLDNEVSGIRACAVQAS